jgi:hypothetical protein
MLLRPDYDFEAVEKAILDDPIENSRTLHFTRQRQRHTCMLALKSAQERKQEGVKRHLQTRVETDFIPWGDPYMNEFGEGHQLRVGRRTTLLSRLYCTLSGPLHQVPKELEPFYLDSLDIHHHTNAAGFTRHTDLVDIYIVPEEGEGVTTIHIRKDIHQFQYPEMDLAYFIMKAIGPLDDTLGCVLDHLIKLGSLDWNIKP